MTQNPFEQILKTIKPVDYRSTDFDNQDIAFKNLSKGQTQSITDLVDNAMTDRVLKQTSLVAEGDKYLDLGDIHAAMYTYNQAAKIGEHEKPLTPYTLESKIKLSYAQMKSDNLKQARQTLENLPNENRNSTDVRYALAHIYEEEYKKQHKKKPITQGASAVINYMTNTLGIPLPGVQNKTSQTTRNYLDMAIKELEAIIQKEPNNTEVLNYLGYLQDKKGELTKALQNYQESFDIKPDKSISNRLKILYKIQADQQSSPDYRHAQRYDIVAPLINEGIRLKSQGNYTEALEKFNNALIEAGSGVGLNNLDAIMDKINNKQIIQRNANDALLLKAYLCLWNLSVQADQKIIPSAIKELSAMNQLYPMKETSTALANYYHAYSK